MIAQLNCLAPADELRDRSLKVYCYLSDLFVQLASSGRRFRRWGSSA
jgi:hypothetical protein